MSVLLLQCKGRRLDCWSAIPAPACSVNRTQEGCPGSHILYDLHDSIDFLGIIVLFPLPLDFPPDSQILSMVCFIGGIQPARSRLPLRLFSSLWVRIRWSLLSRALAFFRFFSEFQLQAPERKASLSGTTWSTSSLEGSVKVRSV